jgi:hypothetical protein
MAAIWVEMPVYGCDLMIQELSKEGTSKGRE